MRKTAAIRTIATSQARVRRTVGSPEPFGDVGMGISFDGARHYVYHAPRLPCNRTCSGWRGHDAPG